MSSFNENTDDFVDLDVFDITKILSFNFNDNTIIPREEDVSENPISVELNEKIETLSSTYNPHCTMAPQSQHPSVPVGFKSHVSANPMIQGTGNCQDVSKNHPIKEQHDTFPGDFGSQAHAFPPDALTQGQDGRIRESYYTDTSSLVFTQDFSNNQSVDVQKFQPIQEHYGDVTQNFGSQPNCLEPLFPSEQNEGLKQLSDSFQDTSLDNNNNKNNPKWSAQLHTGNISGNTEVPEPSSNLNGTLDSQQYNPQNLLMNDNNGKAQTHNGELPDCYIVGATRNNSSLEFQQGQSFLDATSPVAKSPRGKKRGRKSNDSVDADLELLDFHPAKRSKTERSSRMGKSIGKNSCDECRKLKVKCNHREDENGSPVACLTCANKGLDCNFSGVDRRSNQTNEQKLLEIKENFRLLAVEHMAIYGSMWPRNDLERTAMQSMFNMLNGGMDISSIVQALHSAVPGFDIESVLDRNQVFIALDDVWNTYQNSEKKLRDKRLCQREMERAGTVLVRNIAGAIAMGLQNPDPKYVADFIYWDEQRWICNLNARENLQGLRDETIKGLQDELMSRYGGKLEPKIKNVPQQQMAPPQQPVQQPDFNPELQESNQETFQEMDWQATGQEPNKIPTFTSHMGDNAPMVLPGSEFARHLTAPFAGPVRESDFPSEEQLEKEFEESFGEEENSNEVSQCPDHPRFNHRGEPWDPLFNSL